MSASTGIAVVAVAQSSVAMQMANETRMAACKTAMPLYDAKTATVEQARDYAECVRLLYPTDLPSGMAVALKVAFVLALIAGGVGAWRGDGCRMNVFDRFMWGMFYAAFAAFAMFVAFGIVLGCAWVLS